MTEENTNVGFERPPTAAETELRILAQVYAWLRQLPDQRTRERVAGWSLERLREESGPQD